MYNKTLATFNAAAGESRQERGCSFADLHTVMYDAMVKYKEL